MMPFSDEDLALYVTGGLSPERRRQIQHATETDLELAAKIGVMQHIGGIVIDGGLSFEDRNEIREAVNAVSASNAFRALRDDIRSGRVVAFVGPDVPQAAGLGGLDHVAATLAAKVATRLNIHDDQETERMSRLGLSCLADQFRHLFGQPPLIQAISEALYGTCPYGEEDLDLHKILLEIPFAMIVSTSWDDLFEQAGGKLDPPVFLSPITNDVELLSLFATQRPLLLQPRGNLRKGNAIAAEYDAYGFDVRHPGLSAFLRSLFFSHRLLFIGYGISDPDLLRYYNVFEAHFGQQARTVWAQSYFLALGMAKGAVERLGQMGLQVIECSLPRFDHGVRPGNRRESAMLKGVLGNLLRQTRTTVNRVERSRRIADFMSEVDASNHDLRVRAGVSPIGWPSDDQLDAAQLSPRSLGPGWDDGLEVEFEQQRRLKEHFLRTVDRVLKNQHRVSMILATDFESLQQRATNRRWMQLLLQNLIHFFEEGQGRHSSVRVIDRRGPYEVQQYIVGDREMAESRKLDTSATRFHLARTTRSRPEVQTAVELFDVCMEGLALTNLEHVLSGHHDPGRKYLVAEVQRALSLKQASRILKDRPNPEPLTRKLVEQLCAAETPSEHEVETVLCTSPPHVVMAVIADELIFEAIKRHLIGHWKQELQILQEDRPGWIIQVVDREGNPKGELDKNAFLFTVCGHKQSELYALHVAGFLLTHDARRLVLRKRTLDEHRFDQGKWDRTISGHVRKDSSYSWEFRSEVLDQFKGCGVQECSFVTRQQFFELCRSRRHAESAHRGDDSLAGGNSEVIAFAVQPEPIPAVYERSLAAGTKQLWEPVRSMVYLGILPTPDLPSPDQEDKHFSDWIELEFGEIEQLFSGGPSLVGKSRFGDVEEVVTATTMTQESWELLQVCREVLAGLLGGSG